MANKNELMLAARAKIEQRVGQSDALLARMGTSREVFERVALNALLTNPNIAGCDPGSLDRAILQCIELGMLPDGRSAAIVPHKGKATLYPMIEGRRQVARNATPGLALHSVVVWNDDHFVHEEGLHPRLEHRPNPEASHDPEHLIAVYAIARAPDLAGPEWEVMYRDQIDRARARAAASDKAGSPWNTHYAEMARKTVEGALLKRLPKKPGMPDDVPTEYEGADAGGYLPLIEPDEIPDDSDGVWDVADADIVDAEVVEAEVVEPEPKPAKKAAAKKRAAKKSAASKRAAKPKAEPEPEPDPDPEPEAEPEPEDYGDPDYVPPDEPPAGDNPFDF